MAKRKQPAEAPPPPAPPAPEPPPPGLAATGPVEEGFLRAILTNPDEGPRLAYAGWLQEQTDPARVAWGEFIRVQEELWRLNVAGSKAKRRLEKLQAREAELREQHSPHWLGPWIDSYAIRYHRGFVSACRLHPDTPAQAIDRLANSPLLAMLPGWIPVGEGNRILLVVARMPRLDCFRSMVWSGYLEEGDAPALPLLGSPSLTNLTTLELAGCRLGDEAVKVLAGNPALARLTTLNLGSDRTGEVSGNDFGLEGVAALARSPHLASVEVLDLEDAWRVGAEGLRALLRSRRFPRLRSLSLEGAGLDDDAVTRLATSPFVARLRELRLRRGYYQDEPLGDPAALALAASPHLGQIERLVLGRTRLGEAATLALRQRFGERVVIE
jgi:uncharacterized protein (TIGR02996 family)